MAKNQNTKQAMNKFFLYNTVNLKVTVTRHQNSKMPGHASDFHLGN